MKYQAIENRYIAFLKNIKRYFENSTNRTLFQKRNTIKIVNFETDNYVVKSFKIPHFLNRVVYRFFRASKAKRSYLNSVKLLELKINTPKPIGYIEFTSIFFFQESFYVSEFFDYDFEIRAVFKDKKFPDRENILKEFIDFSYTLHKKGVYHIDYSPGNILVKKENNRYIFSIIDVNRMKFIEMPIELCMQSLAKLTKDKEDNAKILEFYGALSDESMLELKNCFTNSLLAEKNYLAKKKRIKKLKKYN